jgi:hypothetical protein
MEKKLRKSAAGISEAEEKQRPAVLRDAIEKSRAAKEKQRTEGNR